MIRGLWTHDTIGWLIAVSLLPVAGVALASFGAAAAVTLATALIVTGAWQLLFRQTLGIPFSPSGVVTAVALTVLGAPGADLWQTALAASFGIIIADLLFGGWGRNVVPAAVAALAFEFLSFPALPPAAPDVMTAIAAGIAALILLATGILSLRTLVAFAAVHALTLAMLGAPVAVTGALAFGAVFLVADPVASGTTPAGRWIHGGLAGFLAALLAVSGGGAIAPQPIVFAALLAAIFAPLIDYAVTATAHARRSKPHG